MTAPNVLPTTPDCPELRRPFEGLGEESGVRSIDHVQDRQPMPLEAASINDEPLGIWIYGLRPVRIESVSPPTPPTADTEKHDRLTVRETLKSVLAMRLGQAAATLASVATLVGIPMVSGMSGPERIVAAPTVQPIEQPPYPSFEMLAAFQGVGDEAMAMIKDIHKDVPELKIFMAAIQFRESSGNAEAIGPLTVHGEKAHGFYQIVPKNWPEWSMQTFGEVRPKTPENQQIVASYKMKEYYLEFQSWDLVAVAWFAGPDRARALQAGDQRVWNISDANRKAGYRGVTVRQYVDNMQRSMAIIKGPLEGKRAA